VTPRVWVADLDEAETVAELMVEFRDWMGRDWPSANAFLAGVERLIERPDTEYLLGAADDDSPPAGVVQLRYRWGLWHAGEDCWLEDLYVSEAARGRGLGSALTQGAIERARERGCKRIELDVSQENAAARALYERHGFSAAHKPPAPNVLMGLSLS
jgi:ribosomal protein S18 acetylase RimI-like enzyme